jgi:hypothetical protein
MKTSAWSIGRLVVLACALTICDSTPADAALTAAQRRQISSLRRDVTRASSLLRRKKIAEAEKALGEIDTKLNEIAKKAGVTDKDTSIAAVKRAISQQRLVILKAKGSTKGKKPEDLVSFEKDIAPILRGKCLRCHGDNNPQGGLRLSTFAGIEAAGSSKRKLFLPGKLEGSALLAKLTTTNAAQRMPKGTAKLSREEIEKVAIWILQGGRFDGKDKSVAIGEAARTENITIPMATGREKVSFKEDIAPFFVNLCMRCHQGNNPRGGFSMTTFENIMKGGDSGRVLLPGNLEGSRLFRLTGGLELPRMPNDRRVRITRKNYEDLRTWVLEGVKFDGEDPKKTLRSLVPTEEEVKAMEFAKLTPEEFIAFRKKRNDEQWDRVLPKDKPRWAEAKETVAYGNVSEARLIEVSKWSEDHFAQLRKTFGYKGAQVFGGKLTIYVMKDRFGFDEFVQVIQDKNAPRDMTGLSVVTPSFEDAYVLLEDVGDDDTGLTAGLQMNLVEHLTAAYMKRKGGNLPGWLVRGTGLVIAGQTDKESLYLAGLKEKVPAMIRTLGKPEDVFANGTFSPASAGAVGYSLVDFMLKVGGGSKFSRFVKSLQGGKTVDAALKEVYKANTKSIAAAYVKSLGR